MDGATALQKIDQARLWLAEAKGLDDIMRIRDLAEAARTYAQAAKLGLEAQNNAADIKLHAERKAGELVGQMPKATGAREPGTNRGATRLQDATASSKPTYSEIGIEKTEAYRWQAIASVPEELFERHIAETKGSGKELTSRGVHRIAKELKREQKREKNRELVESAQPVIIATGDQKYQTVVIDPPWDWGDEGDCDQYGRARPTYDTMSIDEIAALPVGDLTEANAHLYLWITNRSLPKGFGLLEKWGFRYITLLTWVKPSFGMGNYFRGSTEHVIFGVKGSLSLLRADVGTHFLADRTGRHSGKPGEFYELVESCSPGPWLDMFAREHRPGWVAWGAEV